MVSPFVTVDDRGSLPLDCLVFALLGSYSLVLQQRIERAAKILQQCRLLVVGLHESVIVLAILLQFLLEELILVVGYRFLIED